MAVKQIIAPRTRDLGEFSVQRILPSEKQRMVGPWIFFDHMGPAEFPAGKGINVRPHPHINLATVTYLFEGEILHRDCLGSLQPIIAGDINLMVAGRGITHSERERDEVHTKKHSLHGLQLWHALPEEHEEIEPAFYHYPSSSIPHFKVENIEGRVMMGTAYGVTSPVKTFTDTIYVEANLKKGDSLPVANAEELAVYVVSGSIKIGEHDIEAHHMAILEDMANDVLTATDHARIAIIGGAKMSHRYIEWNFISSRKERIEQAKADWKEGRFNKVKGDEEEFIPLP